MSPCSCFQGLASECVQYTRQNLHCVLYTHPTLSCQVQPWTVQSNLELSSPTLSFQEGCIMLWSMTYVCIHGNSALQMSCKQAITLAQSSPAGPRTADVTTKCSKVPSGRATPLWIYTLPCESTPGIFLPASRIGQLVLGFLCIFRVCWYIYIYIYIYICASALITCAIIMSRTLLPCDLTSVDFGNLDGCSIV